MELIDGLLSGAVSRKRTHEGLVLPSTKHSSSSGDNAHSGACDDGTAGQAEPQAAPHAAADDVADAAPKLKEAKSWCTTRYSNK